MTTTTPAKRSISQCCPKCGSPNIRTLEVARTTSGPARIYHRDGVLDVTWQDDNPVPPGHYETVGVTCGEYSCDWAHEGADWSDLLVDGRGQDLTWAVIDTAREVAEFIHSIRGRHEQYRDFFSAWTLATVTQPSNTPHGDVQFRAGDRILVNPDRTQSTVMAGWVEVYCWRSGWVVTVPATHIAEDPCPTVGDLGHHIADLVALVGGWTNETLVEALQYLREAGQLATAPGYVFVTELRHRGNKNGPAPDVDGFLDSGIGGWEA